MKGFIGSRGSTGSDGSTGECRENRLAFVFIPLRRRVSLRDTSILRLWRAPSPRGCSYHMQYCTFSSQPARYVAYERGKDLSTSLPLTIRSSALQSCHTDHCKGLLIWHAIPRAPLISKLATLQFYDAPRQNLEPINLNPYAFTANHAMSER